MVRFIIASGGAAAQRTARALHVVVLHEPRDLGPELKAAQPGLDWLDDVDGHPALPWGSFTRFVHRVLVTDHALEDAVMTLFLKAERAQRIWQKVIKEVNLEARDPYTTFLDAGIALGEDSDLRTVATDWAESESHEGYDVDEDSRWFGELTRRMAFRTSFADTTSGVVGGELAYLVGPWMLAVQQGDASAGRKTAALIGKLAADGTPSDELPAETLACMVAEAIATALWPACMFHITMGIDSVAGGSSGGARMAEFRNRHAFDAALTSGASVGKWVVPRLPNILKLPGETPVLSALFKGCSDPRAISEGVKRIASALAIPNANDVSLLLLDTIERLLTPIASFVHESERNEQSIKERVELALADAKRARISYRGESSGGVTSESVSGDKDSKVSASAGITAALGKPDAIYQIKRWIALKADPRWDQVARLEVALTGQLTPEMREAQLADAAAKHAGDPVAAKAAKVAALAEHEIDAKRKPLAPFHMLAWGQVTKFDVYPELTEIYDLGTSVMSTLVGRVVARTFSHDGRSVPTALNLLKLDALTASLRSREWRSVDFINDALAMVLAKNAGLEVQHIERVSADAVYLDVMQVSLIKSVGTAVLHLFGAVRGITSWEAAVSSCEFAHLGLSADDPKRVRTAKFMRTFLREGLAEYGRLVNLARYTARFDSSMPPDFMPTSSLLLTEFTEAVRRVRHDLQRQRSEVEDGTANAPVKRIRLPSSFGAMGGPAPPSTAEKLSPLQASPVTVPRATTLSFADGLAVQQYPGQRPNAHISNPHQGGPESEWRDIVLTTHNPPKEKLTVSVNAYKMGAILAKHGASEDCCLHFVLGCIGSNTTGMGCCPSASTKGHTSKTDTAHTLANWDVSLMRKEIKDLMRNAPALKKLGFGK